MNKTKITLTCIKKTIKFSLFFFSITTFICFGGCNKTADFEDLDILTEKSWQLISRTQDGTNIAEVCDLDDTLIFLDAKDFEYDTGALDCDENELFIVADSWKIEDDFTVLRLKYNFSGNGFGSLVEYWKIVELSETTLIIEDASAEDNNQIPEIRTYQN